MNRIRPIAGALLATLMLSPFAGPAAYAEDVRPIGPGADLLPIDETGPAGGTELVGGREPVSSSNDDGGEGSSSAYVEEPPLQTRHFGLNVELSCAVAGKPKAIVVVNHSAEDLPPGTRIKWQLKSEGKRGFFALLSPLAGGDTLVADNVLDGGTNQAADCVARVI